MSFHPGGTQDDDADDDAAAADGSAGTVVAAVVLLGVVVRPVLLSFSLESVVDSPFTQYPTPSALIRHSQDGLPTA